MSLLPVGEALQRLEHEGLIESVPRVGTLVRIPRPEDIRGFYVVREALESQAGRLFVENASPEERKTLREMARRLDSFYDECASRGQVTDDRLYELRDSHMQFHMRIAEGTHCRFLQLALQNNNVLIFNWFYDRRFGRPGRPACFHLELAEVLSGTDPDAAEAIMRAHIMYRLEELMRLLEPYFTMDENKLAAVGAA